MPNYIYCTLIMKGKKKDIDQVRTDICRLDEDNNLRPIDFNKIETYAYRTQYFAL